MCEIRRLFINEGIPMPRHLDNYIALNSTIPVWGAAIRLPGQQNHEH